MNGSVSRAARLAALLGPADAEIGCDECFERLDVFVEAELGGKPAHLLVPGMRAHLAGCAVCLDEHDALLELVGGDLRSRLPGGSRPMR
jgi:Na+-translocating ferredoxin:NAD+ oxidoreductase RNF subunit RnfB